MAVAAAEKAAEEEAEEAEAEEPEPEPEQAAKAAQTQTALSAGEQTWRGTQQAARLARAEWIAASVGLDVDADGDTMAALRGQAAPLPGEAAAAAAIAAAVAAAAAGPAAAPCVTSVASSAAVAAAAAAAASGAAAAAAGAAVSAAASLTMAVSPSAPVAASTPEAAVPAIAAPTAPSTRAAPVTALAAATVSAAPDAVPPLRRPPHDWDSAKEAWLGAVHRTDDALANAAATSAMLAPGVDGTWLASFARQTTAAPLTTPPSACVPNVQERGRALASCVDAARKTCAGVRR